MPIEGRLTICNMSVEFSCKYGFVPPDDTTLQYLAGRPFSPQGSNWDNAVAHWRGLRSDAGAHLFHHWRFLDDGRPNPEFILNQTPYDQAQILLADHNFGCGSSRERAPKALREFDFRAVIAPSFGGIFYNNCYRNGIAPVELPIENIRAIRDEVEASGDHGRVEVNLETLQVTAPGGRRFGFQAPETLRQMLLQGMDEIASTLALREQRQGFRHRDRALRPWAYC